MPPSISNQALQQQIIANAMRNRAAYPANPTTVGVQPMNPMMTNGGRPTPAPTAPPMPNPSGASAPMPGGSPGQGTPTQQVMKAATQAQSPLMHPETRDIAKTLIQKLMQHM